MFLYVENKTGFLFFPKNREEGNATQRINLSIKVFPRLLFFFKSECEEKKKKNHSNVL